MNPLPTMIILLGLSACTAAGPGGLVPSGPLTEPENRLLARSAGGDWADPAPLSGLQNTASADCATTSTGAACLVLDEGTGSSRNLATAREGRCLARWTTGTGTTVATVTLHRTGIPSQRSPRHERLYYLMNGGGYPDVTSRLTDPAAFTRLCDQLLQPDTLVTRVPD